METHTELDLDAIETVATWLAEEEEREHDWWHPEGYPQHCRACLLRHGAWIGDGCPGTPNPPSLPNVDLGLRTTLALVAEVRRLRAIVGNQS